MNFAGVCLITKNVSALSHFYSHVFQLPVEGDGEFAYFKFGTTHVSIYSLEGTEKLASGSTRHIGYGGCVLEFTIEDVDAYYERLVKIGVDIVKEPTTQPWGIRSLWIKDPDGNIVNLLCPVAT